MWKRPVFVIASVVVAVALVLFLLTPRQNAKVPADVAEYKPMVGYLAPDFTLPDLQGKPVTLSSLRGKPVIINFWDTPCPACRQEMPALQEFYGQNKDRVYFLAVDIGESPLVVSRFVQQGGYTFPVLLDGDAKVTQSYGLRYTPTAFAIDAQGYIREIQVGAKSVAILNELLAKAEKKR